jgi:hypothetical protein
MIPSPARRRRGHTPTDSVTTASPIRVQEHKDGSLHVTNSSCVDCGGRDATFALVRASPSLAARLLAAREDDEATATTVRFLRLRFGNGNARDNPTKTRSPRPETKQTSDKTGAPEHPNSLPPIDARGSHRIIPDLTARRVGACVRRRREAEEI